MKTFSFSIFIFLLFLGVSCDSQDSTGNTFVYWQAGIGMEEDQKDQLRRYFDLLKASSVKVFVQYEGEDFKEYLSMTIEDSDFLLNHIPSNKWEQSFERLAYLIMSRVDYADAYERIDITHTSTTSDALPVQYSFFGEDLKLDMGDPLYLDEDIELD